MHEMLPIQVAPREKAKTHCPVARPDGNWGSCQLVRGGANKQWKFGVLPSCAHCIRASALLGGDCWGTVWKAPSGEEPQMGSMILKKMLETGVNGPTCPDAERRPNGRQRFPEIPNKSFAMCRGGPIETGSWNGSLWRFRSLDPGHSLEIGVVRRSAGGEGQGEKERDVAAALLTW